MTKTFSKVFSLALIMALMLAALPMRQAQAATPADVFFSEYIEGSSNNKALEIYNGTGTAVNLATGVYVVQFFFNGSTSAGTTINLTGTIADGDVYVIADNDAAAAILSVTDQISTSNFYNGDDAIILWKGGVGGTIVDSIGQRGVDPGTEWFGGGIGTQDETLRRKADVCQGDSNPDNAFDPSIEWNGFANDIFTGLGSHTANCGVTAVNLSVSDVSVNEGNSGTTSFDFTVSLSSPAGAGGVTFDIATADGTAQDDVPPTEDNDYVAKSLTGQTIPAGSSTYTFSVLVNGDTATEPNETFFVNVTNVSGATVSDSQGQGTIQNDDITLTPIHNIQGASHTSPFVGQSLSTSGIVTVRASNGFYLQDPSPDADDATSEAMFVFTSSAPTVNVGDAVTVSGTVVEFRPGGSSSNNLTTTEISAPSITVNSSGNPLPAPTIIGNGGRVQPSTVIEDDTTGTPPLSVETSGVFDPANDGIDFYESMEAMRVQVNNPVVVGPRNSFGEIFVLADDGTNAGVRTTRGGIVIKASDFNPERIQLDDNFTSTPMVDVGDHFTGPAVGVLDYNFGNFEILITSPMTAVSGGLTRETTTPAGANELAVASFNVENLDPGDGAAKFNELADLIVNSLRSPDIIAVEEVQDNNGATNDAIVDASITYNTLISAIVAAGGPTYDFRNINPVDDQDGGEPGGNIRVGFLFRTDRGLAFVDRPGGGSTIATTVIDNGGIPELSASPGRIDPTNAAFNSSRKPLVGEFTFNGRTLFVIANHFNSKGGDQPLFGRFQPPTLSSEVQRLQQAQIVNNFVDNILAVDPDAKIVVAGDLNDFEFSAPVNTLEGGVLHTLMETLPQDERYSYVFEGNAQSLDHILISDNLFLKPFEYDVVHVNAEFAIQASDHDPQVVRLLLNQPPTVEAGGPYSGGEGSSIALSASANDPDGDTLTYAWDLDNNGSFETSGQSVSFSAALLDGPSSYTVNVRATDPLGLFADATATVNVANVAPMVSYSAASGNLSCGPSNANYTIMFADPAPADTHTAVVDWGDGNTENVGSVGSTFDISHTYALAGTYTATVTVTDDDGGVGSTTITKTVNFNTSGFLQPINPDGTSVFKYNSTIPVKISFTNCDGSIPANLAPTIALTKVSGSTPGLPINEPLSTSGADTTGVMRFSTNQYIYNLATKPLPDPSATYRITITVPSTGQTVTVNFGLRP